MVTRKEVAEKAGVSVSVVSRAMNNSGYVEAEKKKRMIKIYLLWVLLVGSLCCSCTGNKRLEYALEFAG